MNTVSRSTQLITISSMGVLLYVGHAAKRLPLSTVGIIQFLAPTIQFLLGWKIYGEPLEAAGLASFALIWLAVALYAKGSRSTPTPEQLTADC